jgi:hypothetical protein
LKFWKFTMDLSEKEKCFLTSMQYEESSHAPYQRIRFFDVELFKNKFSFIGPP